MTDIKQHKADLRLATQVKEKFLTIIESLPNPVILADEKNQFEYMNQAATRFFEHTHSCGANLYYQADDDIDARPMDRKTGSVESCLPWLDTELAAFADGPEITRSFEKAFQADGVNRSYAVRFSRMQDISSPFLGTVIILEDITEKKRAENALRLSEERFRSIFESTNDSIIVWDREYNYLYANQAAIDHVGATRDKVIGKNIRDGFGHLPDFMNLWMSRVDRVFESGEPMRVEDAVEVGSRFVYSESVISPIKDSRGNMFAVGVLYRDVTERKLMENRLRKQNLALEQSNEGLERANRRIIEQQKSIIEEERLKVLLQMAGATAHELNQPLMALLGYIEMMALDRDNPEKVGKYSQQIEDAGRRIAEIVRKIQTIRHDEVVPVARESAELDLDKPIAILSVEDNDLDFEKIKATLDDSHRVRIEHADDIDVGFDMLMAEPYDLFFVDYALPSGNALDFMAMLAERQIDTPVVVITGKGDEMIASKVIQYGAYDYLPKSRISKKSLTRIIQNTLDKFRMKTEIKLAMEKMAELSIKDELTDLHNRRYFMEFAEREVAGTARYGHSLSLLMLDIDHFKQINDSNGHLAGDTVLKHTADLLTDSIRQYDLACRYGGEEFAVIMPNTRLNDARTFCERLRKKVEKTTVEYEDKEIKFTVSIGLAQFDPTIDKSISHLLKRADEGLYAAKEHGRNRVVAFEDQILNAAG
jgi:two-component system cell cycle response regulator